jgi:hypothetical protein
MIVFMNDINKQINDIFNNNQLDNLKSSMNTRHCLNRCNLTLVYLFHFIQSSGILITTIGTGYNLKYLIWVGVGFNLLASLINIYEQINNSIIKKLLNDIQLIKDGKYIDEIQLIEDNKKQDIENNNINNPIIIK